MKKRKITSYIFPAINTVLMIFIIIITIYPFWNQFILSFAKKEYLYAVEAQWYPKSVDLSSYKVLLHYKDVWIGSEYDYPYGGRNGIKPYCYSAYGLSAH